MELPTALLPLVAIAVVGPMFSAGLGAIDDHEIVTIGATLAAGDLPATDHTSGRYRPLYWILRVAEVAVWGPNATGWYLDRLALALATLVAGYALARRWMPPAIAVLASTVMLVGPQSEAFARLGPQEAFAVPLTLAGFALIGRGGVLLVVAAAFTKEPFVIPAALAVGWTWFRGDRRMAAVGAAGVVVAAAGILGALGANGGTTDQAALIGVQFEGRYLYPFILAPVLALGWLAVRYRPAVLILAGLVVWGSVVAITDARERAAEARAFQETVAALRADGRPIVVHLPNPGYIEFAYALRQYLPGVPMQLDSTVTLPGFGPVGPDHVEVTLP